MLKKIKPYMMPLAMLTGVIFSEYVALLSPCTPFLIAIMLFITYCNISLKEIRLTRMHICLIVIQLVGSAIAYTALLPVNKILAEGAMICILAPTATSAVVITNMLGGNSISLTAYSLLCNITVAFVAPVAFALIGDHDDISFVAALWMISQKVFLLLILPFIVAIVLDKFLPRVHNEIRKKQAVSFYLWSLALIIITGRTVRFIADQPNPDYVLEISVAAIALVICVAQFVAGRRIGRKYNDTVAGGQGLGQKNTILAIWMAQTYLNPISSIAPGAYVLWQNMVNSYQVWRNRKNL